MLLINKLNILKEIYKMKKMRKIIPAFAMLLVAVIMVSSASYAWFSMNTEVTATGMKVTAESDSRFLIINNGATFDDEGTEITASSEGASTLKPVAPAVTMTAANIETAASWHYAYSNQADSSTAAGNYVVLTGNFIGDHMYVAKESFSVGLRAASGDTSTAEALVIKSVTLPTGVCAYIVCGNNIYHAEATNNNVAESVGKMADSATTQGSVITVYYYLNGEDVNVKTTNIPSLKDLTVTIKFGLGATPES